MDNKTSLGFFPSLALTGRGISSGLLKKGLKKLSNEFGIRGPFLWGNVNISYDFKNVSNSIPKIRTAFEKIKTDYPDILNDLKDIKLIVSYDGSVGFVQSKAGNACIEFDYNKTSDEIAQDILDGVAKWQEEQKKENEERYNPLEMSAEEIAQAIDFKVILPQKKGESLILEWNPLKTLPLSKANIGILPLINGEGYGLRLNTGRLEYSYDQLLLSFSGSSQVAFSATETFTLKFFIDDGLGDGSEDFITQYTFPNSFLEALKIDLKEKYAPKTSTE